MHTRALSVLLVFILGSLLFNACRKEEVFTNEPVSLRFSADTILFDTTFTGLGSGRPASVTKQLRVYNPGKNAVRTTLRIGKGYASFFKVNADGEPGPFVNDIEILGHDSVFVFVQMHIDQSNTLNPFIVTDSLQFITNGNIQQVKLVGWGQNAHYFNGELIACNSTWTDDKPYVIYNSVLVPEGCKLTIEEGVRIHSHVGSSIYVGGTLEVKGSKDKPVTFQGDRLEDAYKELASQWVGIRILPKSVNSTINWAVVKNGILGIEVDSVPLNGQPNLVVSNTIIRNMAGAGLVGYTATIKAVNCLVHNIGKYTFVGELGGNYTLQHCTFAGYNNFSGRGDPSFYISNADFKVEGKPAVPNNLTYDVVNCIIDGSEDDEVELNEDGQGTITKSLRYCLVKQQKTGVVPTNSNNIFNKTVLYKNQAKNDFRPTTESPVVNKGVTGLGVTTDLDDITRDAQPDLGCYEFH